MPKQARKYRESLLHEGMRVIKKLATTPVAPGQPPFAEAQFYMANCYGNGRNGVSIDHVKSYHLYVQASKQNHAAATYRTAVCNELGAGTKRNYELAMRFYRKSASLSDTAGLILLHGLLDQPANPREAIVWLRRAASQADEDHPHALHELALHYEDPAGKVVPHDEVVARDLYTQAARLGHAPSQCKLGDAFANGTLACPVDARSSISWYTMAANKGLGEAELALSGWFLTGAEGVLPQSDTEAYQWARRAAAKGIANAEYAIGHYTEVGIGTPVNFDEAKRWYSKAAAQHHARAAQRLQDWKTNHSRSSPGAEKECVIM
ncbi:Activator of Chs3-like protein [Malassezia sympodialis ATCC 42132]|uniref:Activator of Chs3-like protein n=1 Tax=Malassezia sympodialis (strain ATCC 42132) TaxID=1230383 RepID=UPI0002C1BD40|nr:Activator of Chs3-like protein [Malassezia sympodialis ATCC 42132]CCU97514.1 Activator of Chs3-like protein [Malassezia sympodialis ATCC 42132]|eukprot:XP_018738863.1 Activator of Chs3-like protein [Malassezia sympodialis ATCC 42132]